MSKLVNAPAVNSKQSLRRARKKVGERKCCQHSFGGDHRGKWCMSCRFEEVFYVRSAITKKYNDNSSRLATFTLTKKFAKYTFQFTDSSRNE